MRASLFLFFAGSWALLAQEANQGTITGFVYDQSQGVVREAEIAATSQATGQVRSIKSGSDGVYTIAALQPGLYTVRVTAPGFKSAEVSDLRLDVDARVPLRKPRNHRMAAFTIWITL